MISRRAFLHNGLATLFAAPAIVKIASIMPVKSIPEEIIGMSVEEALQESWDRFHFGWADWRGIYGTSATA